MKLIEYKPTTDSRLCGNGILDHAWPLDFPEQSLYCNFRMKCIAIYEPSQRPEESAQEYNARMNKHIVCFKGRG